MDPGAYLASLGLLHYRKYSMFPGPSYAQIDALQLENFLPSPTGILWVSTLLCHYKRKRVEHWLKTNNDKNVHGVLDLLRIKGFLKRTSQRKRQIWCLECNCYFYVLFSVHSDSECFLHTKEKVDAREAARLSCGTFLPTCQRLASGRLHNLPGSSCLIWKGG